MIPARIEPLSAYSASRTNHALTTKLSALTCSVLIFSIQVHELFIYLFIWSHQHQYRAQTVEPRKFFNLALRSTTLQLYTICSITLLFAVDARIGPRCLAVQASTIQHYCKFNFPNAWAESRGHNWTRSSGALLSPLQLDQQPPPQLLNHELVWRRKLRPRQRLWLRVWRLCTCQEETRKSRLNQLVNFYSYKW
jgi:hypothetical protein